MVKITNDVKILLKLRELGVEIVNKDLSELCNIPEKNISRYLKYLESKGLIKRRYQSKHQLRQCFNSITPIGLELDLSTYKKEIKKDKSITTISKTIDEKNGLKTNENDEILTPEKCFIKLFPIAEFLIDEFKQLKTYFRKGDRPSQIKAISNFEKHLEDLRRVI